MRCPNCQKESPQASRFCSYCGSEMTQEKPKKSNKTRWIILLAVCVVGMVLTVILFSGNNKKSEGMSTADEIVKNEHPSDDMTEPLDFFAHLTKSGSAGFTGNASIDVHCYNGNYYYVPIYSTDRIVRVTTLQDSPEILYVSNDTRIRDLCIIDDYIFFMEGSCAISAIDLRTNEYKQIFTVDGNNKWLHTKCYYSEGWIYTCITVKDQEQYTIRFDPEDPNISETLFAGYITGIDVNNSRIFYNYSVWDSGETSSYIYHIEKGESEALNNDLMYYSPMIVVDGIAYTHASSMSYGWGLYSLDAAGRIEKLPFPAEQHTVIEEKLYYRKWDDGLFVADLTNMNTHKLSVDTLPINFITNDRLAMVPVSDHVLAFLGDNGIEDSYGNSGIYLYDVLSGEQYKLD